MQTSFRELRDRFRETLLHFLWQQWVEIGMAGHRQKTMEDPFLIDPEALLLATTRFARNEQRFIEETTDWLIENTDRIVAQRIKNLQLNYHYGCVTTLFEIDEAIEKSRRRGWRSLRQLLKGFSSDRLDRQPLDLDPSSLRGMSGRPDTGRASNLIFALRSLLGGSARAEVIAWLLTHPKGHPAEIARDTAWNSKSIQLILNDLEDSGMIFSERMGREKQFWLDQDPWLQWLRPGAAGESRSDFRWQSQGPLYLGCVYIDSILDDLVSQEERSERLQATVIRQGMEQAIGKMALSMTTAFEMADFGFLFQGLSRQSGGEMVERFTGGVERLSQWLEGKG